MYGIERLVADLIALGYQNVESEKASDESPFAVIRHYVVPLGSFKGNTIDLALPAPPNFPQGVGASIHVRAAPQLLPDGNVGGKYNVVPSALGADWRYWSHNFGWSGERSTRELMTQVNRIFHDI